MQHSEFIGQIADALSKAQATIEAASKDAENPAFKRDGKAMRYADLASIWDACREALTNNGIAVVQSPGEAGSGMVAMSTMLLHSSGEWLMGEMTIPLAKVDAHGYGSAITYARRYALGAMVGVCPADDDGNAAAASRDGDGAANNRPAARTVLDGPHTSITALEKALRAAMVDLNKAKDSDSFETVVTKHRPLFGQAMRDAKSWMEGFDDWEGFTPYVTRRRAEFNPPSSPEADLKAEFPDKSLAWLEYVGGARQCEDGEALDAYLIENQRKPYGFSDAERESAAFQVGEHRQLIGGES